VIEGWLTRRQLVTGGIAAGALGSLVSADPVWGAPAPSEGDSGVLTRALRVEQLVVFAYRRVASSSALKPAAAQAVGDLLGQELDHVTALERALRALGAAIPAGPADTAAAQKALGMYHVHRSLTDLVTEHNCLKLLIDMESVAEGAYFSALAKLSDPALLRLALEIMGCEAQHWTILSGLLHRGNVMHSVPYPFVQGST